MNTLPSVILSARDVVEKWDTPFFDDLKTTAHRTIIRIQNVHDLEILERVSNLEVPNLTPMVQPLMTTASILADCVNQSLEVFNTRDLFLWVRSERLSIDDYEKYMDAFLDIIKVKDMQIFVCAPASHFFATTHTIAVLSSIGKLYINSIPCPILSDMPESEQILKDHDFKIFATATEPTPLFILQSISGKGWDMEHILGFNNDIVFASPKTFLEYTVAMRKTNSIPADAIAVIHPKQDRITVWDSVELTGNPVRKINQSGPPEYIFGKGTNRSYKTVGMLQDGWVDLDFFRIEIL